MTNRQSFKLYILSKYKQNYSRFFMQLLSAHLPHKEMCECRAEMRRISNEPYITAQHWHVRRFAKDKYERRIFCAKNRIAFFLVLERANSIEPHMASS